MSEPLLTLLKWCLLALLYLFFFRVLQATLAASRPAKGRKRQSPAESKVPQPAAAVAGGGGRSSSRRSNSPRAKLVVLAPPVSAGQEIALNRDLVFGRDSSCDVTIDDQHLSSRHASVASGPSGLTVEDLGSTNGTFLNRAQVTSAVSVVSGDQLQIGSTVMEFQ